MCLGKTHAIAATAIGLGAAVPLAIYLGHSLPVVGVVAFAGVAGGYGVLSDLDHSGATLSKVLGPVTGVISKGINAVSGGHRKGTHTIWFAAGMVALVWFLVSRFGLWAQVPVVFIGLYLVLMLLRIAPRRGGAGEIVFALEAAAATWAVSHSVTDLWWVPFAVGVGVVAHILADCITTAGVPVLYPLLPKFKMRLPILGDTGSGRETAFGVLCAVATVWLALALFTGNDWWAASWVLHPDSWRWAA
ncbi:MAG: metal-dependent hydrolase [Nakamurella sp.]